MLYFITKHCLIICSTIGFLIIAKTRYVSLGSMIATVLVPIVSSIIKDLSFRFLHNVYIFGYNGYIYLDIELI